MKTGVKIKKTTVFGIEIECGVERDGWERVGAPVYSYHSSNTRSEPFDSWKCENDSSISVNSSYRPVEFISVPLFNLDQVSEAMRELSAYFEFDDLEMNKSCGCHLHFALEISKQDKDGNIQNRIWHYDQTQRVITWDVIQNIKKRYREWLQVTHGSGALRTFDEYYHRTGYAEPQDKTTWDRACSSGGGTGRREFFMTGSKGVEWRSFNLMPAESWEMAESMIKAAYSIIEDEVLAIVRGRTFRLRTGEMGYDTRREAIESYARKFRDSEIIIGENEDDRNVIRIKKTTTARPASAERYKQYEESEAI